MFASSDTTAQHARAAADIQPDVGVEHIADVYAEALLSAAENAGQTETVLEEFDAVVGEVLAGYPQFETVLASAMVSHEEKLALLERVFGGRLSPLTLDFLKVVSRHGRLDCLRAIHRSARLQYDSLRGRVHVRLTTATPVDEAQAVRLAASLGPLVGGQPVLTRDVDPSLIGGAVVRIGDVVYDGSIANQLHVLRQQMIDRSVHEIQSRRDRFRNPAGN